MAKSRQVFTNAHPSIQFFAPRSPDQRLPPQARRRRIILTPPRWPSAGSQHSHIHPNTPLYTHTCGNKTWVTVLFDGYYSTVEPAHAVRDLSPYTPSCSASCLLWRAVTWSRTTKHVPFIANKHEITPRNPRSLHWKAKGGEAPSVPHVVVYEKKRQKFPKCCAYGIFPWRTLTIWQRLRQEFYSKDVKKRASTRRVRTLYTLASELIILYYQFVYILNILYVYTHIIKQRDTVPYTP